MGCATISGVTSDEIREQLPVLLRGARPPAPAVASRWSRPTYDPSVLLTTAGMHPLKPYFLGQRAAAAPAADDCQKCFRTADIEVVGTTARHLTFFEMLGNFSIGDYFKEGAVEFALELSLRGLRLRPRRHLGHGLRGRRGARPRPRRGGHRRLGARSASRASASCPCPRSENFWQSGPTGPVRAVLGALPRPRRRVRHARRPARAARTSASWSTGTSSSCSSTRTRSATLTPLPAQNIDTGLGLNRMALDPAGRATSIFETDQFVPLMALGRELGRRRRDPTSARCASSPTTRAR